MQYRTYSGRSRASGTTNPAAPRASPGRSGTRRECAITPAGGELGGFILRLVIAKRAFEGVPIQLQAGHGIRESAIAAVLCGDRLPIADLADGARFHDGLQKPITWNGAGSLAAVAGPAGFVVIGARGHVDPGGGHIELGPELLQGVISEMRKAMSL